MKKLQSAELVNALTTAVGPEAYLYERSCSTVGDSLTAIVRAGQTKQVAFFASDAAAIPDAIPAEAKVVPGGVLALSQLSHDTALAIRGLLPWTAPISLRERRTTIGCGDRLGRATPGHIRAARQYAVAPVLAQQSIRELTLTNRTYENVVDDVTFLVMQEGYTDGFGADGDHLKTLADIRMAVEAGMAMITLDLTEQMHAEAENWTEAQVEAVFATQSEATRKRVMETYADRTFDVDGTVIEISALEAKRCTVMYMQAMDFSREAYELLCELRGDAFDLEISIDETEAPTLPAHHLFIIRELTHRNIVVSSLAPRFIGEFQKAIDYIGDLAEFERQFRIHCAISRAYGAYKISIHSGSDKFAVYPAIGRYTDLKVHVKTAGTSWLEAVRAIAISDPALYREIHAKAYNSLEDALKLYHITPTLGNIPELSGVRDGELAALMDQDDARQLVHVTYGGILGDHDLAARFFAALDRDEDVYYDLLEKHFRKHLDTLGMVSDT